MLPETTGRRGFINMTVFRKTTSPRSRRVACVVLPPALIGGPLVQKLSSLIIVTVLGLVGGVELETRDSRERLEDESS